jgi:hypothetical protein
MRNSAVLPQHRFRSGIAALLVVAALVASTASALAFGPVDRASANEPFCTNIILQPWGKAGDTCYANPNQGGALALATIQTHERAGCVTYAGYYGEFYHTWVCTGNNSLANVYVNQTSGWYRGVIRNNNTNWAARFAGSYLLLR